MPKLQCESKCKNLLKIMHIIICLSFCCFFIYNVHDIILIFRGLDLMNVAFAGPGGSYNVPDRLTGLQAFQVRYDILYNQWKRLIFIHLSVLTSFVVPPFHFSAEFDKIFFECYLALWCRKILIKWSLTSKIFKGHIRSL